GSKNIDKTNLYILSTIVLLFLFNFLFSIAAASIVLRYELFMLIVLFVFDMLLLENVYNLSTSPKPVILPHDRLFLSYPINWDSRFLIQEVPVKECRDSVGAKTNPVGGI